MMDKTKLGISQGMLGAAVYFTAPLLGYISLFIVGGYYLYLVGAYQIVASEHDAPMCSKLKQSKKSRCVPEQGTLLRIEKT